MITKETPTEEILGMLIQVNDELNALNYRENEKQYNYLETKRRNLEDIILIRKENATKSTLQYFVFIKLKSFKYTFGKPLLTISFHSLLNCS